MVARYSLVTPTASSGTPVATPASSPSADPSLSQSCR
ncbi:PB1 domain containing protein [Musa troglodytarum]|uniref:PB1 domain containing protein n=1 Tax=Musa troglodytarum TaxID=320322 RepID=A0A9E7HGQ3_9LILI|nr:PB1 domain containing protein [Musa troglodytarum]